MVVKGTGSRERDESNCQTRKRQTREQVVQGRMQVAEREMRSVMTAVNCMEDVQVGGERRQGGREVVAVEGED